jgi:hypothetical protein
MWWREKNHKWRHDMVHTLCVVDKQDFYTRTRPCTRARARTHTHTHTNMFFHGNNNSRKRLNVTLYVHCQSCSLITSVFHCQYHSTNTPYSSSPTCCSPDEAEGPSNKQRSFVDNIKEVLSSNNCTIISYMGHRYYKQDPFTFLTIRRDTLVLKL